jgi:hypothetical protein
MHDCCHATCTPTLALAPFRLEKTHYTSGKCESPYDCVWCWHSLSIASRFMEVMPRNCLIVLLLLLRFSRVKMP